MENICAICGELEEVQIVQVPAQDGALFGKELFLGHKCIWKMGEKK